MHISRLAFKGETISDSLTCLVVFNSSLELSRLLMDSLALWYQVLLQKLPSFLLLFFSQLWFLRFFISISHLDITTFSLLLPASSGFDFDGR